MKIKLDTNFSLDVFNYLAILALEEIGNFNPSQKEITAMEKFLKLSIRAMSKSFKMKQ